MTANTHDVPESPQRCDRVHFRTAVQRGARIWLQLHGSAEPCLHGDWGLGEQGASAGACKNVRWEATVTPDSHVGVTIALHPTIDCSVQGAICTSDSGMLSGGLEMAVPGPSSQQSVQENLAPIGAPTSSGTTQVGETLTVSTSGNFDSDGLTNASFAYQWLADESRLKKATVSFAGVGDYSVQSNEGRLFASTVTPGYGAHWLAVA